MPELSATKADFSEFVTELQTAFNETPTWSDKLNSSLATVLTEMIAGVGTTNQFYIDFAAREAFLRTAKRKSSVYAGARFLGVRIVRRNSATTYATLYNNDEETLVVPSYETFTIHGKTFYNRESVILEAGENKTIQMFAGIPKTYTVDVSDLTDTTFIEINLGTSGFIVAENDLRVFVENKGTGRIEEWTAHDGSIFELDSTSTNFFDNTTGEGDVSILFGDGNNGRQPDVTERITVRYVETNGADDNGGLPGHTFAWPKNKSVSGVTTEDVQGGTAVKDASYYKKYAPHAYRSRKRLVSHPDWISNILLYPGIADVVVQAQKDIAPNDPTWMNVVRVCVLPTSGSNLGGANPNPESSSWTEFVSWLEDLISPRIQIQTYNPIKKLVDVKINVAVDSTINLQEMQAQLVEAINVLFTHDDTTLGKRLSRSDLMDRIKFDGDERRDGIDYVEVLSPVEDVVPESPLEFVSPKSLTIVVRYTEREGSV